MLPQVKQSAPVKIREVKLRRKMKAESAVKTIIRNCLRQVQENKLAMQLRDNPEHIRQMRISLRRLSSALELFNSIAPLSTTLQTDLDNLSLKLGLARDWRILSDSSLTEIEAIAPAELKMSTLGKTALNITNKEEKNAYDAVSKNGFSQTMSALSNWLEQVKSAEPDNSHMNKKWNKKIPHVAKKILMHQQRHLLKIGNHLLKKDKDANPSENHKFRIAVKRSRYSCIFFRDLFPKKDMDRYLASLSALQDNLGVSNDAAVADILLLDLIQDKPDHLASCNFSRGYVLSQSIPQQHKLRPLWKLYKHMSLPDLN